MLVREMHIDFDIKMQKVSSNNYDTFLPQEIDWLLNLAQRRLIVTHSTKKSTRRQEGFFDTYKRVEDLEELVTSAVLPTYTLDVTETDKVFAILPPDFFGIVNHRASTQYHCKGLNLTDVGTNHKIAVVNVNESNPVSPTLPYAGFSVVLNTTSGTETLFTLAGLGLSGLTVKEERYYIISLLLEEINRGTSGVKVYWNSYADGIYNNALVFETDNPLHTSITLTLDTDTGPVLTNFLSTGYKKFLSSDIKKAFKRAARLADNEFIYKMLDNPFHTTRHNNVLLSYENGKIVAHQNNTFYVDNIFIDYIRKPQLINLALGRDCELPEKFHDEIVDKAVQLSQAYIGTETYKSIINENLLNE